MSLSLLALYAGLSLSFGAGGLRVESAWVDPWLLARSPGLASVPWSRAGNTSGLALPGLVWVSANEAPSGTLEHEWEHVRQMQALGAPAQHLAHTITLGQAFEDYLGGELWPLPAWTGSPACPLLTFTPGSGLSLWACRGALPFPPGR